MFSWVGVVQFSNWVDLFSWPLLNAPFVQIEHLFKMQSFVQLTTCSKENVKFYTIQHAFVQSTWIRNKLSLNFSHLCRTFTHRWCRGYRSVLQTQVKVSTNRISKLQLKLQAWIRVVDNFFLQMMKSSGPLQPGIQGGDSIALNPCPSSCLSSLARAWAGAWTGACFKWPLGGKYIELAYIQVVYYYIWYFMIQSHA